jgi:2-dehydropantoate 2-reductase
VVCALQNGVEQKAQLEPLVSGATVLPSVVWFPAQREPDASVWLRAKPRLTLPDVPQAAGGRGASRYAVKLNSRLISTVAWRKLLQNAVAGLMVLANRRAGMFRREDISELALAYLREGLLSPAPRGRSWPMTWRRRFWRTFSARLRTSARRFSLTVRRIARWSGTSATA